MNVADKRMADEFHGHARVGVELLLEVKNAQRFGKTPADEIHTPGTPGPKLRANVIDIANAFGAQLAREAKMEAREVDEDGERGLAALRFIDQMAHGADERRQALEDFGDSHDGNFGVIGDDVDACGAHLWAAHTEEGHVEALLQSNSQASSVHVSGGFAGG